MSERGAGPLNWQTPGGYTPESVHRASSLHSFPQPAVAAMLVAADEAHVKRLYEENERGGEARDVVAAVARILDVVLDDTGVGQSMWDPANMRRTVRAAEHMRQERDNYKRAYETKPASMHLEGTGVERLAGWLTDVDNLKATIVSQAREIARLKGESA